MITIINSNVKKKKNRKRGEKKKGEFQSSNSNEWKTKFGHRLSNLSESVSRHNSDFSASVRRWLIFFSPLPICILFFSWKEKKKKAHRRPSSGRMSESKRRFSKSFRFDIKPRKKQTFYYIQQHRVEQASKKKKKKKKDRFNKKPKQTNEKKW